MFMHKVQVLACLALFAGLTACALSRPNTIQLTEKEAGSTVHVRAGDTFEVVLDSNPTTGYTWEVAPGSEAGLALQGVPEFKADSSALGSGGIMTLRFKALQQGTYPLKLIYHRTFEPNVAPLNTFEATVVVDQ